MRVFASAALLLPGITSLAQQAHVVQTDSSAIESRVYPGGKEVKEILTRKDIIYYRFYRGNTKTVTTTATYNKAGRSIGVTREYDDRGNLRYSINHENGSWLVANKRQYPFYAIQNRMKSKADELIAAMYGRAFLLNHAVWNVEDSYIYNQLESGRWTDTLSGKPTKLLFRYAVKLDKQHVYPGLIEFQLDENGAFIPNEGEEIFGFEKLAHIPARGLVLNYQVAIATVQRQSGIPSQQLSGFLTWESFHKASLYNGRLRFYVPVKSSSNRDIHPGGRSSVTDYFKVYSFNPWTGAFVEIKKMKAVRGWEAHSGSSTGLIPDN